MKESAQQTQDSLDFESKLEIEVEKRRLAEDKTRSALTELADVNARIQELQSQLEDANRFGILYIHSHVLFCFILFFSSYHLKS